MNKLLISLIFATGCCKIAVSQPTDSVKQLPTLNWSRARTIDVKHIAIDLRFDWTKQQAYGTAAITLSTFKATSIITLDAAYFTINAVSSNEKPVKFEYDSGHNNDNLKIKLDRVYTTEEDITVKIDYRTNWVNVTDPNALWGSNGKGIRFFKPASNDLSRPREIWSMGQPESNRYWFPCYDSPNDLRTTEFTATVDKKLVAVSMDDWLMLRIMQTAPAAITGKWTYLMPIILLLLL